MKITYYGHSCLQLEVGGKNILIDPFISPNEKAGHIDPDGLKPDYLLLTHGHEDHIADAVHIAENSGAQVIANFEVANWISKRNIGNVQPLNQGGTVQLETCSVKAVNAVHSSSMPDGSYGGNPLGYVIQSAEGNIYHSGDTALTYDMKLIAESTPLTAAALCIGDLFTMGIADAVTAAQWVGANKVIGLHYDTFPPIEIDHTAACQTFAESGIELNLLEIGGSLEL
ncbi:MAG: metal-dependent hydrolase [Verrucomicrobiota bacterium]